jgi:hypothetical protein
VPTGTTIPQNATASNSLTNAFFRHSQSAQEFFAGSGAPTTAAKPTSASTARKQGVRDLNAAQVTALAAAVAQLNMNRVRPYLSLEEFLTAGTITKALDPTASVLTGSTETDRKSINDGSFVTAGLPSFLSQADVVTSLAPSIVSRSDTFVIRAYGDAINPASDPTNPVVESTAYCEAIVQRVPDLLDPAKPALGRRFVVIYFRWLSPDDV